MCGKIEFHELLHKYYHSETILNAKKSFNDHKMLFLDFIHLVCELP